MPPGRGISTPPRPIGSRHLGPHGNAPVNPKPQPKPKEEAAPKPTAAARASAAMRAIAALLPRKTRTPPPPITGLADEIMERRALGGVQAAGGELDLGGAGASASASVSNVHEVDEDAVALAAYTVREAQGEPRTTVGMGSAAGEDTYSDDSFED